MPVSLLFCEGGSGRPDIRVLRAVVPGNCTIRPAESKYGLGQKILISRDIMLNSVIAGLRDRDFDTDDRRPTDEPREWFVKEHNKTVQLGWYWERKEIENYLIDPVVVRNALGTKAPDPIVYRTSLQASAEFIADYTAARIALAISRIRFSPLSNSWGRERGSDRHKFPDALGEADCCSAISAILKQYEQTQTIQENEVLSKFNTFLSICRPGGYRFQHFLTYFSGKDLLFGMETTLASFGFTSPFEFRERILKGIENSAEDVWTWLPEWTRLRELLSTSSL